MKAKLDKLHKFDELVKFYELDKLRMSSMSWVS